LVGTRRFRRTRQDSVAVVNADECTNVIADYVLIIEYYLEALCRSCS